MLEFRAIGGHQSPSARSETWLTPPAILEQLGPFDLDPCAAPEPRPWPTASAHYTRRENGLRMPWRGRVWLNPPYGGPAVIGPWMRRMAGHGCGTALLFARTETEIFFDCVWDRATALLFLRGRLNFHLPDGRRANKNAGAPSVLIAYGRDDAQRLAACSLQGRLVYP